MSLQRKRRMLVMALVAVLAASSCLAGCSQAPSEALPSESDLSPHKKTHAHHPAGGDAATHTPHEEGPKQARSGESPGEVAEKAKTVLKHLDEHHEAPK